MKKLIKNPSFEFLTNENGTVTIFDEDMTVIYNIDNIGKIILSYLNEPISQNSLEAHLLEIFSNMNFNELNDFLQALIAKSILIEAD